MPFVSLAAVAGRTLFPGVVGHYAHSERFTIGEVELIAGAIVPTHQHLHAQLSYVVSGQVEFTIGEDTRILATGDCALIPGNMPHSIRAITAARVLDTFTPPRDDYR